MCLDVSYMVQWKCLNGQAEGGCSKEKGHKSEMLLQLHWLGTAGTDRVIPLFDHSERDGSDGASIE